MTIPDHLFGELPPSFGIVDDAETVIVVLHNRPGLANIPDVLQGGLVVTLIDVAGHRRAPSPPVRAARLTLSFAVLTPRADDQPTAP